MTDLANKQASQLFKNPNFLGEGDFIDDKTGKLREFELTVKQVEREQLQLPGRSLKQPCSCGAVNEQTGKRLLHGDCCAWKVVLSFKEAKKRLVMNKTNTVAILSHHGKQVGDWYGKQVTVYYDPSVRFGADIVGGVRIRRKA